jgi:hypothetical protein
MLFIVSWALGEMLGAPIAASLAQATADAVPLSLLAGALVLSGAVVAWGRVLHPHAASM